MIYEMNRCNGNRLRKWLLLAVCLPFSICLAQQKWSLQECIDYAIRHNVNVQKRAVEISKQEITLDIAKKAWLPQLNLQMYQLFGFENPVGATTTTDYSMAINEGGSATTATATLSMHLFDGFKVKNQIQADKFSLSSATANLEAAKKDISIQVATHYLECLYYKGMADVARRQIETSRELVNRAASLVEEGKRPRSEQADAEAQLASDEHAFVNDEGKYTLSLVKLAHILNIPDVENFRIADDEQDLQLAGDTTLQTPQLIYENTVATWPTLVAAQANIRESEHLLKVKKADYYPQIDLVGSIGTTYYNLFHSSYFDSFGRQLDKNRGEIIGLSLSYPIFNRFQTRNSVKRASADILEKKLDYEDARLKLREHIQTAYYNASVAQKKQLSAAKACEASRISTDYEQIRYEEGRSNIFDLIQAQQKYVKAQQDMVQAKYEYLIRQRILNFYRQ